MANLAQPDVFINYISQRKKIIVNDHNHPTDLLIQTDYYLNDTLHFQIINGNQKIVQLDSSTTYQLYGTYIDARNQMHILFYTLGVLPVNNTLSFLVNTYTSEYLNYVKNNRTPIEISIVAKKTVEGGSTRSSMVLRDKALANPRGYIEGQAPTDIVYQNVFTTDVPVSGVFGAGSNNLSLAQDLEGQEIYTFAFGDSLSTNNANQFVIGYNNEMDADQAFIIANDGNIFTVDYQGNVAANSISATNLYISGEAVATNQEVQEEIQQQTEWVNETFQPISTAQESYQELSTNIDTNKEDIDIISATVEGINTTLTSNVDYLSGAIDENTSSINDLISAVGSKADQSDLENLSGNVEDLSSSLTQQISDVDGKVELLSSTVITYYATKEELGAVADAIPTSGEILAATSSTITGYAYDVTTGTVTKEFVNALGIDGTKYTAGYGLALSGEDEATEFYLTATVSDIEGYDTLALKDELTALATKDELTAYVETDTLTSYATKDELTGYATVDSLTAYAETDTLTSYATKDQLTGYATVDSLSTKADKTDLTGYVENDQLTAYATVDSLTSLATKDELTSYVETDTLTSYATKDQLTSYVENDTLTAYAQTSAIPLSTSQLENDSGFITLSDVPSGSVYGVSFGLAASGEASNIFYLTATVSDIEGYDTLALKDELTSLATKDELTAYATTDSLSTKADKTDLTGYVETDTLTSYATKDELTGYATTDSLTSLATKDQLTAYAEVDTLTSYATKDELTSYVEGDQLTAYATVDSLTAYATVDSLSTKADKTDLTGLATKDQLTAYAETDTLTAYATKDQLTGYATTDSLTSLATKDELTAYVETDTLTSYATVDSLTAYATTDSLSTKADKSQLTSYVETDELTAYATVDSLSTKADKTDLTAYVETDQLTAYATKADLDYEGVSPISVSNDHKISIDTSELGEIYTAGYGLALSGEGDDKTEFYLTASIPTTVAELSDHTDYALKNDLTAYVETDQLTSYATKDELTAYATVDSLSTKADKSELTAYATKDQLTAYAETDELTAYATTDSLSTKADKSEVQYISSFVSGLPDQISAKADSSELTAYATVDSLSSKADKSQLTAYISAITLSAFDDNELAYNSFQIDKLTFSDEFHYFGDKIYIQTENLRSELGLNNYATKNELSAYAYVSAVPTAVSQLVNDLGFITQGGGGGGGTTYTPGDGIDITNDEISVKLSGGNNVTLSTDSTGLVTINATGGGSAGNIVGGAGIRVMQDGGNTVISIATATLAMAPSSYTFDFRNTSGTVDFDYISYNGNQNLIRTISGSLPNGITASSITSGYQFDYLSAANCSNGTTVVTAWFDAYDIIQPTSAEVTFTTIGYVSASVSAATNTEFTFDVGDGNVTSTFVFNYVDGGADLDIQIGTLPAGVSATVVNNTVVFTADSTEFEKNLDRYVSISFNAIDIEPVTYNVLIHITGVQFVDYTTEPLTFEAVDGGATLAFENGGGAPTVAVRYQKGIADWADYTMGTQLQLSAGQKVAFSGNNSTYASSWSGTQPANWFTSTSGKLKVYGNLRSLINFGTSGGTYTFCNMFAQNTHIINVQNLIFDCIPSTYCYVQMFRNCTSLTAGPKLITCNNSYNGTGYPDFYMYTFWKTALTSIPFLDPRITGSYVWCNMFQDCTSLKEVMLPFTNISWNNHMDIIFKGCTNLSSIDVSFTDWASSNNATNDWVSGVQTTHGVFYKPATLSTEYGDSRIPNNWTVIDKNWSVDDIPAITFNKSDSGTAVSVDITSAVHYSGTGTVSYKVVGYLPQNVEFTNGVFSCVPSSITDNKTVDVFVVFTSTDMGSWSKVVTIKLSDPLGTPLTFTALQDNCAIELTKSGSPNEPNLKYSKNGGAWTNWNRTPLTFNNGDTIALSGNSEQISKDSNNYYIMRMSGAINASGNIMSLINYRSEITAPYCFANLFNVNNGVLRTAPLLPATELATGCYYRMFRQCSNLVGPIVLPATTLAQQCYYGMFDMASNMGVLSVAFTEWDESKYSTFEWIPSNSTGTFYCPTALNTTTRDATHIPTGWTVVKE